MPVIESIGLDSDINGMRVQAVIEQLKAALAKVPPEFQDKAELTIYLGQVGADTGPEIDSIAIEWERPFTENELVKQELARKNWAEKLEAQEREQLNRLRAKYDAS